MMLIVKQKSSHIREPRHKNSASKATAREDEHREVGSEEKEGERSSGL